uniref:C-type lectin mannose-binding isoform-like n=1 Tax=Saccoglossus kowalevskii TaxID=10224 RepID=A0ABM0MN34_SACKO|nr:PREDICTED: C-type lectin mannose-binding isoform-like [Saccoglossus kowalevskii]
MAATRVWTDTIQRRTCPSGFVYWADNGYCYRYFTFLYTFNDADIYCGTLAAGCKLASIHSIMEEGFVYKVVGTNEVEFWIGLNDIGQEGSWVWTDGSPYVWSNWDCGEPNNNDGEDCVHSNFALSNRWNDTPCDTKYGFVCKVKAT